VPRGDAWGFNHLGPAAAFSLTMHRLFLNARTIGNPSLSATGVGSVLFSVVVAGIPRGTVSERLENLPSVRLSPVTFVSGWVYAPTRTSLFRWESRGPINLRTPRKC
jgi:hypothetical protein